MRTSPSRMKAGGGEGRGHMRISRDTAKTPDAIQQPFMIKRFNNLGLEGNYLSIIKAINEKPTLTSYSMVKG